ncbi:MAG: hypothetical protein AAGB00_02445 [Planctomycetota bacterium]
MKHADNPTPRCWAAVLAAAVGVAAAGCGGYGEVSPEAYQHAKAIYNIAGRKAADRIDPFCEKLDAAQARGEVSATEAAWLHAIADDARRGDWQAASRAARQLMEEQIR